MNLWLAPIPGNLRDMAVQRFEAGDALGFLILASNESSLDLVYENWQPLRERGIYEAALAHAFTATRTNNNCWPMGMLRFLFRLADRVRLLAAGDPLPGDGPFTVYRGVAGRGAARRVRGLSWTASQERAGWFAARFTTDEDLDYSAHIDTRADLPAEIIEYANTPGHSIETLNRMTEEAMKAGTAKIIKKLVTPGLTAPLADPAVYRVTVEKQDVLFYSNQRKEEDFTIILPLDKKPVLIERVTSK